MRYQARPKNKSRYVDQENALSVVIRNLLAGLPMVNELNETDFERFLMSLLVETKRRNVIPTV